MAPQRGLALNFFWNQDLFLGIDKVVGTCVIGSPCFLHHIGFHFLRNVDVIILSPSLGLEIEGITVIVTAISASLVNEQRIQMVGSALDRRIATFNLFLNIHDLLLELVYFFIRCISVVFKQFNVFWCHIFCQVREADRVIQLVFVLHVPTFLTFQEHCGFR